MNECCHSQARRWTNTTCNLSPSWIPSDSLSAALCINYDTLIHLVLSFVTILTIYPIMLVLSLFYDKNEDFFVC